MNEQRARDAVEHLQAAAVEVIESLRAFLDVAEDIVRDPGQLAAIMSSPSRPPSAPGGEGTDDGVTRIRVS